MRDWFLKTIGLGDQFVGQPGDLSLDFQHWKVLAVGMALLLPVSVFIVWWQRRNLQNTHPLLRAALSVTRILVLALLVIVLASPIIKADHSKDKRPIVAFLFDHSQSMQLPAGPFEAETDVIRIAQAAGYRAPEGKVDVETRKALNRIGRAKLAQTVVQNGSKSLLEPLFKKYDVQFYSFAKDPARFGVDAAHPQLPEPPAPGGPSSHLGDAIAHVVSEAGGREIAGILLFSDGQNTGGRSPVEAAQGAAAVAAPVYTVPVGAPTRLRDVAIVDVFTSGLVSVGDNVRVAVTIESQGFDKRPVKVQLLDGDKLLDSKDLTLSSAEQQQLDLTFQAKEAGAKYLTVEVGEPDKLSGRVKPLPEEPEHLRGNNQDTAFVRVSDEKLKVLYLEGLPRWDFRFLKNAMRRDHGLGGLNGKEPDIQLEAEWRRMPQAQQAVAFPHTLEDLAKYHTIILGDVSPRMVNAEFVKILDEAVRERGVGLVIECGPLAMPLTFNETFKKLLPVKLDEKATAGYLPRNVAKPFKVELTPEGSIHEALRFYDDPGRNQNAWGFLPPFYWCLGMERPTPAASVLVWESQYPNRYGKLPLVSYQYAGKGKVMLVGTDATWRWRQNVGDRFFYKFWGQGIRFVARRDTAESKKSRLEVRPIRAQPGEQAQVELMAFGADGTPRTEPTLPVRVTAGDQTNVIELTSDTSVKGRYTGGFPLPATGEYRVAFDPAAGAKPIEAKIRVLDSSEELRHPNVNRIALEQIAGATKDLPGKKPGGQMVELTELAAIPDRLQGETKAATAHREQTIWDNWLTLGILVFIYSLDVGLRRLAGLS